LPTFQECEAFEIPHVALNCPWLTHSEEDNVMECLDGHRCRLDVEGWACCEHHYGRAKCPRDIPVMCDTLCSGQTEYCCGLPNSCTPRPCSAVLQPGPEYLPITTTTTYTTEPPGSGGDFATDGGLEVRIPRGTWVWLILLVPSFLFCAILFICVRIRNRPRFPPDPVCKMDFDGDKLGNFWMVKPKPDESDSKFKRPVHEIVLHDIPNQRPLGIELLELKVQRLHELGEKNGWEVGDQIVEIAGVAVSTFEEFWERLQVERNRLPVRIIVQRMGEGFIDAEERAAVRQGKAEAEAERVKKRSRGSVGQAPLQEVLGAQRPWGAGPTLAEMGLPSALVGWETWAQPPAAASSSPSPGGPSPRLPGQPPSPGGASAAAASEGGRGAKAGADRNAATTRFMRSIPLTPGAKLLQAVRRKDPDAGEVRTKEDAWGRTVVQVGPSPPPKRACEAPLQVTDAASAADSPAASPTAAARGKR